MLTIHPATDTTNEPQNVAQKEPVEVSRRSNPSGQDIQTTNWSTVALTNSRNKPRVSTMNGRLKKVRMGSVIASYVRAGPPGTIIAGDNRVLLDGLPVARVGVNAFPGIGGPILRAECEPGSQVEYSGGSYCTDRSVGLLEEAVRRGDTRIPYREAADYSIGDGVIIGTDEATSESAIVVDRGSLILDRPLQHDDPAGTMIVRIPAEHSDQVIAPTEGLSLPGGGGGPPLGFVAVLAGLAVVALGASAFSRWEKRRSGQKQAEGQVSDPRELPRWR